MESSPLLSVTALAGSRKDGCIRQSFAQHERINLGKISWKQTSHGIGPPAIVRYSYILDVSFPIFLPSSGELFEGYLYKGSQSLKALCSVLSNRTAISSSPQILERTAMSAKRAY